MRVAVLVGELFEQKPLLFQERDDALVRLFDEHARKVGDGGFEAAALVHHVHDGQAVLLPDAVVVLAEGGRDVHDARAVGQGDVPVAHDVVRLFAVAALGIGEERFVFAALVFAPLLHGERCIRPLFEQRGHERLREHVARAGRLDLGVVLLRVDAQRDVGRERPRRGRPGEEIRIFKSLASEADEDGRLFHVLVSLRDLVRRERGAAARAVRHDLVPLVQEALFPDLFERPPHGLDVLVVVGDVRVLHVRPVADAFGHALPFALVLPHALLALLDKGLDAVLFNILLAVHAEQFFDLQLDGQAVRIPARLAQDVAALHRLVARDDVLHHAREDMPDVRLAVRRRGTVVEGKFFAPFALLHALFEHAVFVPEVDDFLFAFDEVEGSVYLFIRLFLHIETLHKAENAPFRLRKNERTLFLPPKRTAIRPLW